MQGASEYALVYGLGVGVRGGLNAPTDDFVWQKWLYITLCDVMLMLIEKLQLLNRRWFGTHFKHT